MTIDEIRAYYEEKIADDIPRWGKFDRVLVGILLDEITRLKEGNFTPEEFHNLCHNRKPPVTREEFAEGCRWYQEQLFGKEPMP